VGRNFGLGDCGRIGGGHEEQKVLPERDDERPIISIGPFLNGANSCDKRDGVIEIRSPAHTHPPITL
jgi:hypothetical protein